MGLPLFLCGFISAAVTIAAAVFSFLDGEFRTGPYVDVERVEASIPHAETRYYYQSLDRRMKSDFCALYDALENFEEVCDLPYTLSREEFEILQYLLMYDCPELLQYDKDHAVTADLTANKRYRSIHLNYLMDKAEYEEALSACQAVVKETAESAEGLDEWEKEKLAYDFVTNGTSYVLEGNATIGNAAGVLLYREAKCDGISLALKWLCEEMGLPSYILAGENERFEVGHVWNVIEIEGAYYDVDATGDAAREEADHNLYGAYNVSKNWSRYQYQVRENLTAYFSLPGTENMDRSYYVQGHAYLRWDYDNKAVFFENLEKCLSEGENIFFLQVAGKSVLKDFREELDDYMAEWNETHGSDLHVTSQVCTKYNLIRMKVF